MLAPCLELWLVRHGETVWNREGRVQGDGQGYKQGDGQGYKQEYKQVGDPPLSETGRAQARRLEPRLKGTFTAVYNSGLQRTTETAQLALPGVYSIPDVRLRELGFGVWEGRTWQEVAQTDPDALAAWYHDPYCYAPTGGETYTDLEERVQSWVATLPPTGRVLAFTHGGPIRAVLYGLTGVPNGQAWRFELGPVSLTKLVLGDAGAIVRTVGDAAHLEELR